MCCTPGTLNEKVLIYYLGKQVTRASHMDTPLRMCIIHTHGHTSKYVHNTHTWTPLYVGMCIIHTHVYTSTQTCTHKHTHRHARTYRHAQTQTCTYIPTRTDMHIQTHRHARTHTPAFGPLLVALLLLAVDAAEHAEPTLLLALSP